MNTDDVSVKKYCEFEDAKRMYYLNELRMEQEKLDVILLSDICGMLDKGIMIQQ